MFGTTYLHNKILISFILFQKTHWFWPKNGIRIKQNFLKPSTNNFFSLNIKCLNLSIFIIKCKFLAI
jgi:hypothetical protein